MVDRTINPLQCRQVIDCEIEYMICSWIDINILYTLHNIEMVVVYPLEMIVMTI